MKAKQKCQRCAMPFDASKAQCPSCSFWHITSAIINQEQDGTVNLDDVEGDNVARIKTGWEWDKCFGGDEIDGELIGKGITLGSAILLGGKAGAGKSTAAIQIADAIALSTGREAMYIAAEESASQIKDRAIRIKRKAKRGIRLFPMGNTANLGDCLRARRPSVIILDSLQGFTKVPDEQVDLCKQLKIVAVELNCPAIIIGRINKDDDVEGVEALKHEVDTVCMLFPTGQGEYRSLETDKNRFGTANIEITLLMTREGLVDVGEEPDTDSFGDTVEGDGHG